MFNTLILPHLPKIKSWVSHSIERAAEFDDILQEVLIEIFRNLHKAEAADNLLAFLYALTRRKVRTLNTLHRRNHIYWADPPSPDFFEQLPADPSTYTENTFFPNIPHLKPTPPSPNTPSSNLDPPASPPHTPETRSAETHSLETPIPNFTNALFQRALETLTPLQREVILARSENESHAEISKRIGLPRSLIYQYEYSARNALVEYLRPALHRRRRKSTLPHGRRTRE